MNDPDAPEQANELQIQEPQPHHVGRCSKKTPKRVQKLLEGLSNGLSYKTACLCAGIHFDTFNEWRKADSEFSDQVAKAESEAIRKATACVLGAAKRDWRAAAWFLERRLPEEFGKSEFIYHKKAESEKESVRIFLENLSFE